MELAELRHKLLKIAAADTAYDPKVWEERKQICLLTGHCYAVALLVQKFFGGYIMRGKAVFNKKPESHYWNMLPSGIEVDLTGSQYSGDGLQPVTCGEVVKATKVNPSGKARAELLLDRIKEIP